MRRLVRLVAARRLPYPAALPQVTKGKESISFYTIPEYEEWKERVNTHGWAIKYYKVGVGGWWRAQSAGGMLGAVWLLLKLSWCWLHFCLCDNMPPAAFRATPNLPKTGSGYLDGCRGQAILCQHPQPPQGVRVGR